MTEDRGWGSSQVTKGDRIVILVLEWDKELSLDREETYVTHRKMEVYKGTVGNAFVRMRHLILI